jgi:hypothetical protein
MATSKEVSQVVPITLHEYWHEGISREDALQRLEQRKLERVKHDQIAKNIPPHTDHFLTFDNGAFREYAFSGEGTAALLLLLPLSKRENEFVVYIPIHHSEVYAPGARRHTVGIDLHVFTASNGTLLENGVPRTTFHFSNKPVTFPLDVSFAAPMRGRGKTNFSCCGACEWVHSALDIHIADPLCCLGRCGGLPQIALDQFADVL